MLEFESYAGRLVTVSWNKNVSLQVRWLVKWTISAPAALNPTLV